MVKKIIFFLSSLLIPLFVFAENAPQDVYFITLLYDKGNVTVGEVKTGQTIFYSPKSQPENGYTLNIISQENKVFYSVKFSFLLEIFFAPPSEWFNEKGEQIYFPKTEEVSQKLDQASVLLTAPFDQGAKEFLVLDPQGKEVLRYGLADFEPKSSCGDGFCQVFENEKSCPQDCKITPLAESKTKEPDSDRFSPSIFWIPIGALIFIGAGVFYWRWKERKNV